MSTHTNIEKAAILLMNLELESPGSSQAVLKMIGKNNATEILQTMSTLKETAVDTIIPIIDESYDSLVQQQTLTGGKTIPNQLYTATFASHKNDTLFQDKEGLFEFIEAMDSDIVLAYFKSETPQLIAAILYCLNDTKTAHLLSQLSPELSVKVSTLLLSIDIPSYSLLWQLHHYLKSQWSEDTSPQLSTDATLLKLVKSIEIMPSQSQQLFLSHYQTENPQLLASIKRHLLTFEKLVTHYEHSFQTILYEIKDTKLLATALADMPDTIVQKTLSLLSERFQMMLAEEQKQLPHSIPESDVQNAHIEIIKLARTLELSEKITLPPLQKKTTTNEV